MSYLYQRMMGVASEPSPEEFPTGLACALLEFQHKEEVLKYIRNIREIYHDVSKVEADYQAFMKILDLYQDQPKLITPSIQELIKECLDITMKPWEGEREEEFKSSNLITSESIIPAAYLSLKYLRHIFKVHRLKKTIKFMPHEIINLAPVLTILESINVDDNRYNEAASVLIYWLSLLVINPFELGLLDGSGGDNSVAMRILEACMKRITLNNTAGAATPVLLAKFLTRPDMLKCLSPGNDVEVYDLHSFIDWACQNMGSDKIFSVRCGAISGLAAIFKQGKRSEISVYGKKVLDALLFSQFESGDSLLRKFSIKLLQRVGMIFLKSRIALWRYERGSRSLLENLQPDAVHIPATTNDAGASEEDTDQYEDLAEFASEIETILDILLKRLDDKEFIVRWSAAKGLGRIVNRIPKSYGNDIVDGILQLMQPTSSSGAWAGACLALAELGRKGLLLPIRLSEIVDVIQKALFFEEIGGGYSGGRQVRDCACYVAYQFARCFEPQVMKPYVDTIATSLVLVAVFDREINCRRAAAAAFQENVGRQGGFPHGLQIIALADYATVANKANAYTEIAVTISLYPEYVIPMYDHLTTLKFGHLDASIRELTAMTLQKLTIMHSQYACDVVLERLLTATTFSSIEAVSGAILSLAHIIFGNGYVRKISAQRLEDIYKMSCNIINSLSGYSAPDNVLLREALNALVHQSALSKTHYKSFERMGIWYNLLKGNVFFPNKSLQKSAAQAMGAYLQTYVGPSWDNYDLVGKMLAPFVSGLEEDETKRIGSALVIGSLTSGFPKLICTKGLDRIIKCATINPETAAEQIESRREAMRALGYWLSCTFPKNYWQLGDRRYVASLIYDTILAGLKDYSTDKRGDVGCLVREAAIVAARCLLYGDSYRGPKFCPNLCPDQVDTMLAAMARQCVEKIDKLRSIACNEFLRLMRSDRVKRCVEFQAKDILEIFPEHEYRIDSRNAPIPFTRFVHVLAVPRYEKEVLTGFITTGGSLGGSSQQEAMLAVYSYMNTNDLEACKRLTGNLLDIFKNNIKNDKISLSLMRFTKCLLERQCSETLGLAGSPVRDAFAAALMDCVKSEIHKCTNVDKIVVGVEILVELFQEARPIVEGSLKRLAVLLGHPYPRVRKLTAEKMITGFRAYEDNMGWMNTRRAVVCMEQVQWERPAKNVREFRNKFCELLGIPIPETVPKREAGSNAPTAD